MSLKIIIPPTGRLSDELLLKTVYPDPASGTILGPIQQSILDHTQAKSQPILDGPRARYFYLLTGELLKRMRNQEPSQKPTQEEDWVLEPDAPAVSTNQISLISRTSQSLHIDLRDSSVTKYTIGFKSSKGAIAQTIGINPLSFEVTTNFYSLQIPCINFTNIFDLALKLSTILYTSGTYGRALLGDLQFHQHSCTIPLEFNEEACAFEKPRVKPDEKNSFTIASTESAFQAAWSSYSDPVVEMEASPKPNSLEWMLNMILYRSPHSPNRLMPLQNGLLNLWKMIEENISRNGVSSPIKKA